MSLNAIRGLQEWLDPVGTARQVWESEALAAIMEQPTPALESRFLQVSLPQSSPVDQPARPAPEPDSATPALGSRPLPDSLPQCCNFGQPDEQPAPEPESADEIEGARTEQEAWHFIRQFPFPFGDNVLYISVWQTSPRHSRLLGVHVTTAARFAQRLRAVFDNGDDCEYKRFFRYSLH